MEINVKTLVERGVSEDMAKRLTVLCGGDTTSTAEKFVEEAIAAYEAGEWRDAGGGVYSPPVTL